MYFDVLIEFYKKKNPKKYDFFLSFLWGPILGLVKMPAQIQLAVMRGSDRKQIIYYAQTNIDGRQTFNQVIQ